VRCNVPDDAACALIAKPAEEEKCTLRACLVVDDERYDNEILSNSGLLRDTNFVQSTKRYTWRTEHWSSVSLCMAIGYTRVYVNTLCDTFFAVHII